MRWVRIRNVTKVSKGAKIRNRYNQVPHLTQDTNGKVTNSQLDTTNESQEVRPFNLSLIEKLIKIIWGYIFYAYLPIIQTADNSK